MRAALHGIVIAGSILTGSFCLSAEAATASADTSVSTKGLTDPKKAVSSPTRAHAKARLKPGEAQGFNPQPDPPGSVKPSNPGETHGFNPQPDPPGSPRPDAPNSP